MLSPAGRMIIFEKTRPLARRVPFQRALAGRGLQLVEPPQPIRYRLVEEVVDDGPLYVVQRGARANIPWDEAPEPDEGLPFEPGRLPAGSSDPDSPLYENHWPSAQRAWERLGDRTVVEDTTRREADGRQMHVELGRADAIAYLYCSNTFDQRQLVVFPLSRCGALERYYEEIRGSL
jgi:hypothetical protein